MTIFEQAAWVGGMALVWLAACYCLYRITPGFLRHVQGEAGYGLQGPCKLRRVCPRCVAVRVMRRRRVGRIALYKPVLVRPGRFVSLVPGAHARRDAGARYETPAARPRRLNLY